MGDTRVEHVHQFQQLSQPSPTSLRKNPAIKKSGLWNVNYVDKPSWDPEFLEVFDYYARATIGEIPFVNHSVAPWGWWDRARSRNQMNFWWNDHDRHAE